jgi:hypothetical protein
MPGMNEATYHVPFIAGSSLAAGLRVSAALGGGAPHAFLLDTGSVGVVVPRSVLGPDYQQFNPSEDITFQYVSSGNQYSGQWVRVPVVLGVPADWDGTGDFPIAHVEYLRSIGRLISRIGMVECSASVSRLADSPMAVRRAIPFSI